MATENQNPAVLIQPNRDITHTQIQDCLTTISSLTNCLRLASTIETADVTGESKGKLDALDGGIICSLEVSLRKACDCLDLILEDKSRWKVPVADAHNSAQNYFDNQIKMQYQNIIANDASMKELQLRLQRETDLLTQALREQLKLRLDAEAKNLKDPKKHKKEQPPEQ